MGEVAFWLERTILLIVWLVFFIVDYLISRSWYNLSFSFDNSATLFALLISSSALASLSFCIWLLFFKLRIVYSCLFISACFWQRDYSFFIRSSSSLCCYWCSFFLIWTIFLRSSVNYLSWLYSFSSINSIFSEELCRLIFSRELSAFLGGCLCLVSSSMMKGGSLLPNYLDFEIVFSCE